jgi:glycosyltransferase involved in cell wall biosynthesis
MYVEAALQSIFVQSFQDYEIIIVNDGSTEWGARSALENFKAAYSDRVNHFPYSQTHLLLLSARSSPPHFHVHSNFHSHYLSLSLRNHLYTQSHCRR